MVIGGGAGGLTVASGAASLGATVALIEKNSELGGDCLHYGCVPSKAFIAAAKEVHQAQRAAEQFGFELNGKPDFSTAMKRVKDAIAHIQVHDSKERFTKLGVSIYHGEGTFKDKHHVVINNREIIKGKKIVIATGSRPNVPPIEGLKEVKFLTNESIFDLKNKPDRLLVIGGGPIGLEMAQSFARFGSEVTVAEAGPTIFGREDEDMIPIIKKELEKEISILYNAMTKKVEANAKGEKVVTIKQNNELKTYTFDEIIVSAGRKNNIEKLGLENIGVDVDKGAIVVNDYLQTSISNIYAIGDINGNFPFTHAAGMEGKVVVRNAVFGIKGKVNYDHTPWVTYTDPEVYHLGLTEQDAKDKYGEEFRTYKVAMNDVDRFIADRNNVGLLKVITKKNGHILGAHAVGKNASDWMQEIVMAKTNGLKIGSISNVIHPYPTHAAIVQQTADLYWREKLFNGSIPTITKKYIKWFR
ncbi:dihydrolipoyl dehydrogenase family protein [Lottiidibacillus patelloidae]|uniref:dihydrolipoyl dehydrogenase family protein n=1 Tax=Lottiidibacillus patelloidae TaxID=2670334 RepID=UPI002FCE3A7F